MNPSMYHHLIDDQCQMIPGLSNFIQKSGLGNCNTNYNIVSIIGSQNSGKSTLLNRVFGTNFEMLHGSMKVQTTKGIWASRDKEKNLIVLDVEGSNSRQRGKGEKGSEFYERSTALFALAYSQVFIINCNSMNLGHESEYSIIKIIMEMNVRLFKSDQVKQILIVIRDFDDQSDDFEEISQGIKTEIYNIWAEVRKPAELENVHPEQVFKIQFFKASHFRHQNQKFEQEMLELRDRFVNPLNPNNLFSGYNYQTNITIEALEVLADTLWSTIQKNEDLNLPNQKLQASQVRCLRIKDQSLELVSGALHHLRAEVDVGFLPDFNTRTQTIISNSLHHYDIESQYYVEKIKIEMRKVLSEEIKQIIYPIFNEQISSLLSNLKAELKTNLENLEENSTSFLEYLEDLGKIGAEMDMKIQSGIYHSLPYMEYKEDWQVNRIGEQLLKVTNEMINNSQEIQLIKFFNQQEKMIKNQIDSLVSNQFDSISLDFWPEIRKGIDCIIAENENKVRSQISKHFPDERVSKEIQKFILTCHTFLFDDIQKKVRDIPYYLLKMFKRMFIKDERNITRRWKEIKETDIQELFVDTRQQVDAILQEFARFKIAPPRQKMSSSYIGSRAEIFSRSTLSFSRTYLPTILKDSKEEGSKLRQTLDSQKEDFAVLLDASQINKIRNQFLDESEEEFNQVIRLRNTSLSANVPKWLWFVLIFFMYDDVLRWMGNPLLLYPIILLTSFIGLCIATGYKSIPQLIFKQLFGAATSLFAPLLIKLK